MNQTHIYSFTDGLGIESDSAITADVRSQPARDPQVIAIEESRRSVLVTGGSRGIGAAVAGRFVDSGHRVANLSRSGSSSPNSGISIGCDVTDSESVQLAVKQAAADNGPIEVLIANAGVTDDKLML
ncbi:MAG: SDR family NAD(P)-dependent oxidoreductase, partial [Actinobacteria bacterium]|nr:SDR family NAD(P)-dependent oxidoreductase [Actinomycetota bacterium]